MKLSVIGGGGVRAPLLMPALARRQEKIGLDELVLMDTDERKLSFIAPLAQYTAQQSGASFKITWTTDAREALEGTSAVITTIRIGGEGARAKDERIALEKGVLGQETTGAGGFAMALRTVPVVAYYAEQMRRYCPDAWLLNFTNPAGLVAQAITEQFPDLKVVGICDTPSSMRREVAAVFGKRSKDVPVTIFGLNHLSWMSEALIDGENVVPRLVSDPDLIARIRDLSFFEPGLLRLLGLVPNEYLYYYYYRERAVANMQAAGETRGEQVERLSGELIRDLAEIDPAKNPARALERYRRYLEERHGSYMSMETGSANREQTDQPERRGEEGEGYAGVALDILTAERGEPATLVVNVPSRGALPGMRDDDVVEITCQCDAQGLRPIPMETVPEDELLLMQQVKRYERLTAEAIRTRSCETAIEALLMHPLVGSYSIARSLVDEFLTIHAPFVGEWL